ncbi:MAG: hypothetical protein ACD_39C00870G0003 [uncultured bacterium]|nr:MAG: hypothetical protein ACD_39C00870G0003 [uncultured bacterium]
MLEVKKKIRSCEVAVVLIGALAALVLALIWHQTGKFYHSFLVGYFLGFASFLFLAETFAAFDTMPKWFSVLALLLTTFKLLLLGLLIYALKMLGFSVVEIIFGLLFSQLAIIFSFLMSLYLDKNAATGYKKASNART